MNINHCHIILLLLCTTNVVHGQDFDGQKLGFYKELALKDARYENEFEFASAEDELDYWNDQINFEGNLKRSDAWSYQIYLNNKRKAYSQYQKECHNCERSEQYLQMASFYAINGAEPPTKNVVSFTNSKN